MFTMNAKMHLLECSTAVITRTFLTELINQDDLKSMEKIVSMELEPPRAAMIKAKHGEKRAD